MSFSDSKMKNRTFRSNSLHNCTFEINKMLCTQRANKFFKRRKKVIKEENKKKPKTTKKKNKYENNAELNFLVKISI